MSSENVRLSVEIPRVETDDVVTEVRCGETAYFVERIESGRDLGGYRVIRDLRGGITGRGLIAEREAGSSDPMWDYDRALHEAQVKVRAHERARLLRVELNGLVGET
jgi:hypothetical protein